MAWIVRFLIAAAPAVAQWFYTPVVLRFGALQALLSFAVFVGFTLVLVLVPWPRDRGAVAWTAGRCGSMPAADDLRRAVRLARWRPRTALGRLWARLRAAWQVR